MKCRLHPDLVRRQPSIILDLFSVKYQALLIWWNTFRILDLLLDNQTCVSQIDMGAGRVWPPSPRKTTLETFFLSLAQLFDRQNFKNEGEGARVTKLCLRPWRELVPLV